MRTKEEHREYMRQYYEKNKDKIREKNKIWRENNREYHQQHRKNNIERYREADRKYRENNREKRNRSQREYARKNRDKINQWKQNNKDKVKESNLKFRVKHPNYDRERYLHMAYKYYGVCEDLSPEDALIEMIDRRRIDENRQ